MKALATGEAGVDLVPVLDGWLAQPPAKVHQAAVDLARKIDEPRVERRFCLGADARELLDISLDLGGQLLDLPLEPRDLVALRRASPRRGNLALGQSALPYAILPHQVLDDAAHEREGAVRGLDGEEFGHTRIVTGGRAWVNLHS